MLRLEVWPPPSPGRELEATLITDQVCDFTISQELNVALFYFRLKVNHSTATSETYNVILQRIKLIHERF